MLWRLLLAFSSPEIFSEFSGKTLIFLRLPGVYRVPIRKVFPSVSSLGACFSSSTSGCDTKKVGRLLRCGIFPAKCGLDFSPSSSCPLGRPLELFSRRGRYFRVVLYPVRLSSRVALYGVLISIYNLICFIPFHLLRSRKEEDDDDDDEGGRLRENSTPPPRAIRPRTSGNELYYFHKGSHSVSRGNLITADGGNP